MKQEQDTYFTEVFKKRGKDKSIILLHNRNNKCSFDKIVNYQDLRDIDEKTAKTDKIMGAYNFFKENITTEDNIELLDKILNQVVIVVIELSQEEDEQQIFDTLNSLGVR